MRLMQHFPRISFLLGPQELQSDAVLCEYVELQGRERALFRSSADGWPPAVEAARGLPLGPASAAGISWRKRYADCSVFQFEAQT